jgi:hypothetical protein
MNTKTAITAYTDICIERLKKTTKTLRIADLRAEILSRELPKTKHEYSPLGRDVLRGIGCESMDWILLA